MVHFLGYNEQNPVYEQKQYQMTKKRQFYYIISKFFDQVVDKIKIQQCFVLKVLSVAYFN